MESAFGIDHGSEISKLDREDKRGLFWDGGHYAADRAKGKYKAEARNRVTRGQGIGGFSGLAAGAAAGGAVGGAVARGPGAMVGGYAGGLTGAITGSTTGGKKAFKNLKREGKIQRKKS